MGSGFRVQGTGFRVQGSGFRVQGLGVRVQGVWFGVQECGGLPRGPWWGVTTCNKNLRAQVSSEVKMRFQRRSLPHGPWLWVVKVGRNDGELRSWHFIHEGRRGRWGRWEVTTWASTQEQSTTCFGTTCSGPVAFCVHTLGFRNKEVTNPYTPDIRRSRLPYTPKKGGHDPLISQSPTGDRPTQVQSTTCSGLGTGFPVAFCVHGLVFQEAGYHHFWPAELGWNKEVTTPL